MVRKRGGNRTSSPFPRRRMGNNIEEKKGMTEENRGDGLSGGRS
jgi:hypothetical protein